MKFTNLRAFEKHLEDSAPNHFANLYLIISKEPYDKKAAFEKLRSHLSKGQNVKMFEGESLHIGDALSELNSLSFFAKQNLIVIHNIDKVKKGDQQTLEDYFAKPNPQAFLLLTATSLSGATNFYKKIEKAGVILDVAAEKPWEKEKTVADWFQKTAWEHSKKISLPVCQMLVKQMGVDQSLLEQELHKLICYVGDRSDITVEDIKDICLVANIETIWQLGDAIFRRDSAGAIRIFRALMGEGSHFLGLLRQVRGQFQTGLQISSILTQGGTSANVTALFPYMKGTILEKNVKTAQDYGLNRYKNGLLLIDKADIDAKNSGGDIELIADMLMMRLTQ